MPHLLPSLIAKGLGHSFRSGKLGLAPLDLTIDPGEIHAVVGYSGAGKTTLAELLCGAIRIETGSIHLQGQLTTLKDEADAVANGIRILRQDWDQHSRVPVVDALELGVVPKRFGFVDTHALYDLARSQLGMFGLEDVDPKSRVCDLSVGKQKLIQIAAIISKSPTLLILDEPTAALTEDEGAWVLERLQQLRFAQTGILYLTSDPNEALRVGSRISVLRDGHLIATHDPEGVFAHQLWGEMQGREVPRLMRASHTYGPEVGIRIEGVSCGPHLVGFSVKAKRGEILGILGLQAAGQSEALQAVAGVVPKTEGAVFLKGSGVPTKTATRDQARASGIGFVPEPRGLLPEPVSVNFGVSTRQPLRSLNSENPQKAPIARCLNDDCSVLLFDNPSRGLNVACRLELPQAIIDIADQGVTVLIASTDVEELVSCCDRICLMVNGRIVRTVERPNFDAERIMESLKKPRI